VLFKSGFKSLWIENRLPRTADSTHRLPVRIFLGLTSGFCPLRLTREQPPPYSRPAIKREVNHAKYSRDYT
jgi:hypothetical protein